MNIALSDYLHPFKQDISGISVPDTFTFPFYYQPHPLCRLAAEELQQHLEKDFREPHNFGLKKDQSGLVIGKMFGVLVVKNEDDDIGHLWAFSGKLADKNHIAGFVPPVYDTLNPEDHFKKMEVILNQYNSDLALLECHPDLSDLMSVLEKAYADQERELDLLKEEIRINKSIRGRRREAAADGLILIQLSEESKREQIRLKHLKKHWKSEIEKLESEKASWEEKIRALKDKRKQLSHDTQSFIFSRYNFLNALGHYKNVSDIFQEMNSYPPSGAGECAIPKLLQFAYQHRLTPLAMGEFWWGQSPPSEVRKHRQFYPSCRSKCEPILNYMLQGLDVDENPMATVQNLSHDLSIVYEDNYLTAINKPPEMLSVPGKNPDALSLYDLMRERYPDATGPLLVHRLDMSTSGIILIAKSKEVHENLQSQFIKRTVKKRYTALLDGLISPERGTIRLPIRVDLDNRPRQLVCYEYGKMSVTEYEVTDVHHQRTRIHFYPVTGRTHQLRLHAAHQSGLNCPILGDDLYGLPADRLYLHADLIEFRHPVTKEIMTLSCPATF